MQCKVFFFNNNNEWSEIDKHLTNITEPFQIITNSYSLNEFLNKKRSKTFREIFPEEGSITYDVYVNSKKIQQMYLECFKNIKFRGFPVFAGIENQLVDQVIVLEKVRKILEEKKNTIFIFEDFYFTYFAIMRLANELGYKNDLSIGYLQGNKIKYVKPEDSQTILNLKTRFRQLMSTYFPRFSRRKLFSRHHFHISFSHYLRHLKSIIVITKTNNKISIIINTRMPRLTSIMPRLKTRISPIIQIAKRLSLLVTKAFLFRTLTIMNLETTKIILKKVDQKLASTEIKYQAECALFFTTNPEDLYLKSLYPILDKLKKEKIKFQIFVVDMVTANVLSKRGIPFVDLFEEVNILTNVINISDEGKSLNRSIRKVAIGNNLSLLYTSQLNNQLIRDVYHTASILTIFDHVISKMDLKSIIVATDGQMFTNLITSIAKKHKITSYFIPSTIINSNPLHADYYHAEKICMYGLQGVNTFKKLNYAEERIVVTGNPKYDHLKTIDPIRSKKFLEVIHHIDSKKKLVVIGMARWHKNDEVWMSNLIKFCNQNNFEIVIKVHPTYKSPGWYEESEVIIKTIAENCPNFRYTVTYDIDLYTLLSAADLVITDYSNVGAEAALLDKPMLTVNFIKENIENEQRYHEYGAALYFEDYAKMENAIKEILIENMHLEELGDGRKKLADMYNYYNDGKATQRIFDLLLTKKELPRITA